VVYCARFHHTTFPYVFGEVRMIRRLGTPRPIAVFLGAPATALAQDVAGTSDIIELCNAGAAANVTPIIGFDYSV
jgi:uroporphyrinogen-III decarboxylase